MAEYWCSPARQKRSYAPTVMGDIIYNLRSFFRN
jgi:hypothetical protein